MSLLVSSSFILSPEDIMARVLSVEFSSYQSKLQPSLCNCLINNGSEFNGKLEFLVHSNSVQFSCLVVSNSLRPHGLQHARLPCPSPTPGAYSNSHPSSRWCHPTILSSVVPFSSCLQSFPASGSFQIGQFFASGGQNIGISASASVLPMNIQD